MRHLSGRIKANNSLNTHLQHVVYLQHLETNTFHLLKIFYCFQKKHLVIKFISAVFNDVIMHDTALIIDGKKIMLRIVHQFEM